MAITDERLEMLHWYWDNETNDPDTQEWRDDLTSEEEALVDSWDRRYCAGVNRLCTEILKHGEGNHG